MYDALARHFAAKDLSASLPIAIPPRSRDKVARRHPAFGSGLLVEVPHGIPQIGALQRAIRRGHERFARGQLGESERIG